MDFGELDHDLLTAQNAARQAYDAASLVQQGARLNPRWGTGWSRPKAIFARHRAAVLDGASAVRPQIPAGHQMERSMWQLPASDRDADTMRPRPRCTSTIRTTGMPCTASAAYLGDGTFAAHCYSHTTPTERERYHAHQCAVAASESDSQDRLRELRHRTGERITQRWLLHRRHRLQGSDQVGSR